MFIIHSGQTGVERGAHLAARAAGLRIAGFAPPECRDELGALPDHVRERLTPYVERGSRPATRANIAIASAALVIVPQADQAEHFSAMLWLLQGIRGHKLPLLICDASTSLADVAAWASALPETCGSRRLLVTGPRFTRWPEGEALARRLIGAIASSERTEGRPSWRVM